MDLDLLERFGRLKQCGALTEEEFQQQKAELLGSSDRAGHLAADEADAFSEVRDRSRSKWPWMVVPVLAIAIAIVIVGFPKHERSSSVAPSQHIEAGIAPKVVNADTDSSPSAPRTPAAPVRRAAGFTTEQSRLIDEWKKANEMCRGSSDEQSIETWCPRRDEAMNALNRSGVCYGRESDQSAADYQIHLCAEGSYRN